MKITRATFSIVAVLSMLLCFSGCESTPKQTISLTPESISPVAIMEIKLNSDLSAYYYSKDAISGGGLLGAIANAAINAASKDSSLETTDLAEYTKTIAYEQLPSFPEINSVLPESTLLSSEAYKKLKGKSHKDVTVPSGYKLLTDEYNYGDKSLPLVSAQQAIAAETGAKGFAYIYVYCRPEIDDSTKSVLGGKTSGNLKAKVSVTVCVFDVDGHSMAKYEAEYPGYWNNGSHYANTWKGKNNLPYSKWFGSAVSNDSVKITTDYYDSKALHELFTTDLIRSAFKQAAIRKAAVN